MSSFAKELNARTIPQCLVAQQAFANWNKGIIADSDLDICISDVGIVCDTLYALGERGPLLFAYQNILRNMVEMRNKRKQK